MRLNKLFITAAVLAAGVSPALAGVDPVSLFVEGSIFGLLSGAGVATATALAITPVIFTGLTIGALVGINYLLAPKLPSAPTIDPGKMRETFTASDSPEVRAIGRVRVGGTKIFGDTNGTNRYRLVAHCKGLIDAIETYYVGGREVTVEANGDVSSPPWPRDGGSWLNIKSDLGNPNKTAWSDLLADFASIWTANHRARGIAQTLAKYISPGFTDSKFIQLYQNGAPDVEVLIRAENSVYDTRTATTGWSENGILNILHIARSYPELNDLAFWDTDFISSEANRADVLTDRYGAVQTKRARAWGFWSSDAARGDTMSQALDSIGAIIIPRANGTKLGIQLLDDVPTAEATIASEHIQDITWHSGPQSVERPNLCRLQYYSPERNYEMTQIDLSGIAWANIDAEITANGEKPFDLNLPFCPDAGQAQRIARLKFSLARADAGVLHTNLAGLAIYGCRFVNVEFPDELGTFLCLIGVPRILDSQGQLEIPFIVWPTLPAWDTATDEAAPPAQIPDLAYGSPLTVPDAPIAAAQVDIVDDLGAVSTVTRVSYTVPGDAATVEATYRVYTGGVPGSWQGMTENGSHADVAASLGGETVDFRFRTFNGDNGSTWSPILNVSPVPDEDTAPGEPSLIGTTDGDGNPIILATAPSDLQVAYMVFTGTAAPTGHVVASPSSQVSWASSSGTFTAQAFTAADVGGPIASLTVP